jgi:hypothetical protein
MKTSEGEKPKKLGETPVIMLLLPTWILHKITRSWTGDFAMCLTA